MELTERVSKIESILTGYERSIGRIEKFLGRWTSGDDDVDFGGEVVEIGGILLDRMSAIEAKVQEHGDKLLAIELALNELKSQWPTPQEAIHANTTKSNRICTNLSGIIDRANRHMRCNAQVINESEQVRVSAKSKVMIAKETNQYIEVIGDDALISEVGKGLEVQSGGVIFGRNDAGGKIESVTSMIRELDDDVNRHLVVVAGSKNLKCDDSTGMLNKLKVMLDEIKKAKNRKVSVLGLIRRFDCSNSVERKRSLMNLRLKEMCKVMDIEYVSCEMERRMMAKDGIHLNRRGQHELGHQITKHSYHFLG